MASWASLKRELDIWSRQGNFADFWIRDDDAVADTARVRRLIEVTGDTPLALSVIPAHADESLAKLVASEPQINVWQHGWKHQNWATQGFSEYPAHRSIDEVAVEVAQGRDRLEQLFGPQFSRIFVPPCSGFDDRFFPVLERLGFEGYSAFEARKNYHVSNVRIINTHCEIIEWATPPWFADEGKYIQDVVSHLVGRRTGMFDRDECTGILTHHKQQDEPSYTFLAKLIRLISRHPGARWRNPLTDVQNTPHDGRPLHAVVRKAVFWITGRA